jgi:trehalose-phosphatase
MEKEEGAMTEELMIKCGISALERWEDIFERLSGGEPAVLLDYDGTLTPIVEVPSKALLSERMRGTLRHLAAYWPVAVVSGRDLEDVRTKVGLDQLVYAGSHGFEVVGPYGSFVEERGESYLPSLDRIEDELRFAIGNVRGALVERKRFAVALHYRLVDLHNVPRLKAIFEDVAARYPDLRRTVGKMVLEVRPDMDWDKGKAVELIVNLFNLSSAVPVYIGDDVTDEDAFRAIGDRGVTILVSDVEQETAAHFRLAGVSEVQRFLEMLIGQLEAE